LSLWACGQRACVVHHVHSDGDALTTLTARHCLADPLLDWQIKLRRKPEARL
jgi:hypothetical protein